MMIIDLLSTILPDCRLPRSRRNNYGFNLGGPVYIPRLYDCRGRTFFYFNFEQNRSTSTMNMRQTIPTEDFRKGDFRSILTGRQIGADPLNRPIMENAIYNPSPEIIVNGLRVRDPFMGCDGQTLNVICTDPTSPRFTKLDPVALNIQALIPKPTDPGLTNTYLPNFLNPNMKTIPSVKIDHSFSPKIKLSGYWSFTNQSQYQFVDGLDFPGTQGRTGQLVARIDF